MIDTGLQKVARYDAERAIDSLTLERVTLDSADQRAGRAGRLGPVRRGGSGTSAIACGPHREPEIQRVDLACRRSSASSRGAAIRRTFEWFEAPPDRDRVDAALDPAAAARRRRRRDG